MSNAESIVLGFVSQQNRPLNVQNVADALQKDSIKKTAIQKILDSAAEAGKISYKDYGKQRIFLARQDALAVLDSEALDSLKKQNGQKQEEIVRLKETCSSLEKELSGWQESLTNAELDDRLIRLENENKEMARKVATLKSGSSSVSSSQRKEVDEKLRRFMGLWRQRRRVFNSFFAAVTENMTRNLKDFRDELGIETDEDVKVDPKQFNELEQGHTMVAVPSSLRRQSMTPASAAKISTVVSVKTPQPQTPVPSEKKGNASASRSMKGQEEGKDVKAVKVKARKATGSESKKASKRKRDGSDDE